MIRQTNQQTNANTAAERKKSVMKHNKRKKTQAENDVSKWEYKRRNLFTWRRRGEKSMNSSETCACELKWPNCGMCNMIVNFTLYYYRETWHRHHFEMPFTLARSLARSPSLSIVPHYHRSSIHRGWRWSICFTYFMACSFCMQLLVIFVLSKWFRIT